MPKGYWLAT